MWLGRGCRFAPILRSHGAARTGTSRVPGAPVDDAPARRPGVSRLRLPPFDILPFPAVAADRVSGAIPRATWMAATTDQTASCRGPAGFTGRKASPREALVIHPALARGPPARD